MTFYDEMAATATRLLTQFGSTQTFFRQGDDFDEDESEGSPNDTENETIGLFVLITKSYAPTSEVISGDRLLIIDGSFEPVISDRVGVAGEKWKVIQIDAINPAGTPLAYKVRVRK